VNVTENLSRAGTVVSWHVQNQIEDELKPRCTPVEVLMNPVTVKLSTSNPPEPMLEQAIRHRAYELYLQRGMAAGHDVDDWLKAEAELVYGHSTSDSNKP
jgi:Protein of unknown function (DUF2934)